MAGESAKPTKPSVAQEYNMLAKDYVRSDDLVAKWEGDFNIKPINPMLALEYEREYLMDKHASACNKLFQAEKREREKAKEIRIQKFELKWFGNDEMREANRKKIAALEPQLEACTADVEAHTEECSAWSELLAQINIEIDGAPKDPETEDSD